MRSKNAKGAIGLAVFGPVALLAPAFGIKGGGVWLAGSFAVSTIAVIGFAISLQRIEVGV